MIKIGGVSLDVSHPLGFAEELEKYCMDMKYEYVCPVSFRGDDEADWFVKRFGLAGKVDKIEDMVDKVDVGFVQSCNWDKHLEQAMPFIKAGKPVFIDKPVIGNLKDANTLRQLVKDGAYVIGSSSARHADEIQAFLKKPVEERGEIVSIFGTCGVDEFNYSIHIVEIFTEIAGAKATACRFDGYGTAPDGHKVETYTLEFENGMIAQYHTYIGGWRPFHLTIMTTKGSYQIAIDSTKIYVALLREIYRELKNGKSNLADVETLINCSLVMLCGKKSRDELNGKKVAIEELTESDRYDGYAFEKTYAANASKIYKD
ncbi:MAG: Gfo/Idh/MocA family oxidoreductase [Clostridia bacterium]|nr:Gfo/Idh/MocA family oxidoreductase [Clostridia bacterium]